MPRSFLRAFAWIAYGFVLIACSTLFAYLSFSFFVRSGVTAVPNLAGVTTERALSILRDNGLSSEVAAEQRYDETVPAGAVLLQRPSAGSLVKRGSVIELVVSLGQERIEVPALVGRDLQVAQVLLGDAGLGLTQTFGIYSSSAQPGTVVAQTPAAGSAVSRTTPVEVFLSIEGREQTFLMPDLVYRRHAEVERFLGARGFRFGSVKFEEYEGIAPGTILRQHPLPGHPVSRYDVVSLVVATHDEAV
jgi:serine/threonine-protein kinase